MLVAVGLALAAIAAGVTVLSLRDLQPVGGALPTRSTASYRVVYRVEDPISAEAAVTTEVVEVVRPLRSRRVLRDGAPPGTAGTGGTLTTEQGVYLLDNDARARLVQQALPAEAGADLRLGTTLAFALAREQVRRDGTGTVAGRACTWWVSREPLDVGSPAAATTEERTRSCVDDAGLLLADTWSLDGSVVRTRTATEVAESADLSRWQVVPPAAGEEPPGVVTVETAASPVAPDRGVRLAPPPGLAFLTAATALAEDPNTGPSLTRRAVYGVAGDLVVVDQIQAETPPAAGRGEPVGLAAIGPGVIRATPAGLVVEAMTSTGELLRVRSSLPEEALLTWLRSLRMAA